MTFYDWFDPYNYQHILAWREVEKTGMRPEGFPPEDVEVETLWQVNIPAKMAQAWMCEIEEGRISALNKPGANVDDPDASPIQMS